MGELKTIKYSVRHTRVLNKVAALKGFKVKEGETLNHEISNIANNWTNFTLTGNDETHKAFRKLVMKFPVQERKITTGKKAVLQTKTIEPNIRLKINSYRWSYQGGSHGVGVLPGRTNWANSIELRGEKEGTPGHLSFLISFPRRADESTSLKLKSLYKNWQGFPYALGKKTLPNGSHVYHNIEPIEKGETIEAESFKMPKAVINKKDEGNLEFELRNLGKTRGEIVSNKEFQLAHAEVFSKLKEVIDSVATPNDLNSSEKVTDFEVVDSVTKEAVTMLLWLLHNRA